MKTVIIFVSDLALFPVLIIGPGKKQVLHEFFIELKKLRLSKEVPRKDLNGNFSGRRDVRQGFKVWE